MKLYHGSKNGELKTIKKNKAETADGLDVPKDELLEAIYLTPDYGYALAMAVRPHGLTNIDNTGKKITFDNPELFNPNEMIYVYELEIPDDEVRAIDELQYVVENKNEVVVNNVFAHHALDIEQYYELTNWHQEVQEGPKPELKIR